MTEKTTEPLRLLEYLQTHRIVIASVESCTGGLIADQITNIAGSSGNFWGSWVVYDNTAKLALGVPAEIIRQHGAVSSQTALSLAENGLKKLSTILRESDPHMIDVARPCRKLAVVSTTGIAGPGGGTPDKPVGLCYSGVSVANVHTDPSGADLKIDSPVTKSLEIRAPEGLTRVEYKIYFEKKTLEFFFDCLQ